MVVGMSGSLSQASQHSPPTHTHVAPTNLAGHPEDIQPIPCRNILLRSAMFENPPPPPPHD